MKRAMVVAALLVSGCAERVFVRETPADGKGVIYVYRPNKFTGAVVNGGASIINGSKVVRTFPVRNNKYVATLVEAGQSVVTVASADGKVNTFNLDVPERGAAFIRCEVGWGTWVASFQCQQVSPDVGEREVADCKRNQFGD